MMERAALLLLSIAKSKAEHRRLSFVIHSLLGTMQISANCAWLLQVVASWLMFEQLHVGLESATKTAIHSRLEGSCFVTMDVFGNFPR